MAKIKVNISGVAFTGKIVTFTAPCDCTEATGLLIGEDTYDVVDALGNCITGSYLAWRSGAQVSVVLDCENKKAFIQNGNATPALIGAAEVEHTHDGADITTGLDTLATALGTLRVSTGSYTGNGGSTATITLEGVPKLLIVSGQYSYTSGMYPNETTNYYSGRLTWSESTGGIFHMLNVSTAHVAIGVTTDGNTISLSKLNVSGYTYTWFALIE